MIAEVSELLQIRRSRHPPSLRARTLAEQDSGRRPSRQRNVICRSSFLRGAGRRSLRPLSDFSLAVGGKKDAPSSL